MQDQIVQDKVKVLPTLRSEARCFCDRTRLGDNLGSGEHTYATPAFNFASRIATSPLSMSSETFLRLTCMFFSVMRS